MTETLSRVNHAGAARADHAAEAEHYAALVLFENLDAADKRGYSNNQKSKWHPKSKHCCLLNYRAINFWKNDSLLAASLGIR